MGGHINETLSEELTLEMSLEEMALEVLDMLCVALHFAGARQECLEELVELYATQMDTFYQNLPEDAPYGQKEMIAIINLLKRHNPKLFHSAQGKAKPHKPHFSESKRSPKSSPKPHRGAD